MRNILLLTFVVICTGCIARLPTVKKDTAVETSTFASKNQTWILIDSISEKLTVYRGLNAIKEYSNLAFGVAGVGIKHHRGDGITPKGEFLISEIRASNKFEYFIQLNYPTVEYAQRGVNQGIIGEDVSAAIKGRLSENKLPSQETALGGYIGIHGVGKGSLTIHHDVNWTDGCVALTNEQIRDLVKFIKPGLLVEIR